MAKEKSFSQEEQQEIRSEIIKTLKNVNTAMAEEGIREARDIFIERFILCEMVYKIVLEKYLKINNRYDPQKYMNIQITQVKTALKNAGYSFDGKLLDRLFKGTGIYSKRNTKSAKKLRNGIEHEMNPGDLKEVKERLEDLCSDMDLFLKLIQK